MHLLRRLPFASAAQVRERCDNALGPLWDAVRILQSGLRDAAGELKAVGAGVSGLQQAQVGAGRLCVNVGLLVTVGGLASCM